MSTFCTSDRTIASAGYGLDATHIARHLDHLARHSSRVKSFLEDAIAVAQGERIDLSMFVPERVSERDDRARPKDPAAASTSPTASRRSLLTLACLLKAAEVLQYTMHQPAMLSDEAPGYAPVGAGFGAFVSAACAVSCTLEELQRLLIYVVRITARVVSALETRSRRIDPLPGPWNIIVRGASFNDIDAEIASTNQRYSLNTLHQIFIAVQLPDCMIIAGPPSILRDLPATWSSHPWKVEPFLGDDLAFHAGHLPEIDDSRILADVPATEIDLTSRHRHAASTAGDTSKDQPCTFQKLLRHAVRHLTHVPVCIHRGVEEAGTSIDCSRVLDEQLESPMLNGEFRPMPYDSSSSDHKEIAIIGMSGRFPGSDDVSTFWSALMDGHSFCQKIPSERFPVENQTFAPWGCFLTDVGGFDPAFFSISSREAARVDPSHRLGMMVAYEALEAAGIPVDLSRKHRPLNISTFIGQTLNDYVENLQQAGYDAYYTTSATRGFCSGRINYHLGLAGQAVTVDTACSSSAAAVTSACTSLRSRECDVALAGGVNIIASPNPYIGLSKGGFLSPSGSCKSFREDADGYCRGEAVGVLVLKRLSDAIRDNDNILATISGYARAHSVGASSIVHPHAPTQVDTYAKACRDSGTRPSDVSFVEAHGTGTIAGDSIEAESLRCFFGSATRAAETPLVVGAVKANIGHGEAAAGVSSLIKTIMALQSKTVPPQPSEPSAGPSPWLPCFMETNIRPCGSPTALRSSTGGRRCVAMVNTFDATGGSTSIVLREAPRHGAPSDLRTCQYSWHIVTCSAKTTSALQSNLKKLLAYLRQDENSVQLRDIAYTLNARRTQHSLRQAWVVQDVPQLCQILSDACENSIVASKTRLPKRPEGALVFVFAGQGSLLNGCGRELFNTSQVFRRAVEDYQRICIAFGFPNFVPALLEEKDAPRPSSTAGQLATLAFGLALAEIWRSWGVEPELVVGHSLGEYGALCTAGALSVADAIYLVGKRATLMEDMLDFTTHGMLAVRSSTISGRDLHGSESTCEVACVNGPKSRVFGGTLHELDRLRQSLSGTPSTTTSLPVDFAFHTDQMDPILDPFSDICKQVRLRQPRIPVISAVESRIINTNEVLDPSYLVRHLRQPVRFYETFIANSETLCSARYLEIGPDMVCTAMVKDSLHHSPPVAFPSCRRNVSPWKPLFEAVAWLHTSGQPIEWLTMYDEHRDSLRLLPLPTYAFDLKSYWLPWGPTESQVQPKVNDRPQQSFISSTIQHMESSSLTKQVFASSPTYCAVQDTIDGHIVAGIAVCPMSTIGDLVTTAAWHSFPFGPCSPQAFVTKSMEVTAPITSAGEGSQGDIRVSIAHGAARHDDMTVEICIQTPSSQSRAVATCKMQLLYDGQPAAHLPHILPSQIDAVIHSAQHDGQILRGKAIYRFFGRLVEYSPRFQGLRTVYIAPMSSDGVVEAVGIVRLSLPRAGEHFTSNPYWTDALTHLPGLVLNGDFGQEALGDDIFLATGYEEFRWHGWAGDVVEYSTYTRLQPASTVGDGNVLADVVVYHRDMLILSCTKVSFSRMPRQTFLQSLGHGTVTTDLLQGPRRAPAMQATGAEHEDDPGTSHGLTGNALYRLLIAAAVEEAGLDHVPSDPMTSFFDIGLDSLSATAAVESVSKRTGIPLSFTMLYQAATFAALEHACHKLMEDRRLSSREAVASHHRDEGSDSSLPPNSPRAVAVPDRPTQAVHTRLRDLPTNIDASPSSPTTIDERPRTPSDTSLTNLSAYATPQETAAPPTKASLIHGRKSNTLPPVFMMPCGTGRPSDYIHLPPLTGGRRAYVVRSPFLGCEESFTCSIKEASISYLEAIREIQPHGPYTLGGYSVGAAYAIEVARSLAAAGECIDALIIIDYPTENLYPATWAPPPPALAHIRPNSTPHDHATFKALHGYEMQPLPATAQPKIALVIWATQSRLSESAAAVVEGDVLRHSPEYLGFVRWLLLPRANRGSGGWEKIVGPSLRIEHIDVEHHQMLGPCSAAEVGRLINAVLGGA